MAVKKAVEFKSGPMVLAMKETGKMIKLTEKVL
jgi:hypothetical protein